MEEQHHDYHHQGAEDNERQAHDYDHCIDWGGRGGGGGGGGG